MINANALQDSYLGSLAHALREFVLNLDCDPRYNQQQLDHLLVAANLIKHVETTDKEN
ncbi:MAG: hypothetical protein HRT92_11615 [Piscirickettsiaceae bacterium]|nr:hypothetical protein [Piscirickettsiaceae bacterium]